MVSASSGIEESDAFTTAALICEALRQRGAHVNPEPVVDVPAGATSAYHVSIRSLGELRLLEVSFESPIGTRLDTRTVQLQHIEEVPVAAPRIAESLVSGKPLATTAKTSTLVGEETRAYAKKPGELLVGIGVLGFAIPGTDVAAGYGVFGQLMYETESYGVGVELRGGGSNEGDASLVGVGVGGRYFLFDGDITPYIGGGLGVLWISYQDASDAPDDYYYPEHVGSGLAANVDLGVEFLRLHSARFDVHLRMDVPIFEASIDDQDKSYVLPLSLMAAYFFD